MNSRSSSPAGTGRQGVAHYERATRVTSTLGQPAQRGLFKKETWKLYNLYTSSIIALDVDTGQLRWYFQTIPNEGWDYDAVAITQLYDVSINGEMRKVVRRGEFSSVGG
jgi:glucose dehydrogenase